MSETKREPLGETDIVTPECRLAFPALFTPRRFDENGRETYQAIVLIPPDVDLSPFVRAIRAAMVEHFGEAIQLPPDKIPIRRCEEHSEWSGFEPGWRFVRAQSGYQPAVVDRRLQPVLDEAKVYPGVWCHFHLRAFGWKHKTGGRGVSFSLEQLQTLEKGDRLDRRLSPDAVFDAVEVQGDAELGGLLGGGGSAASPQKPSDGLEGLF